MNYNKLMFLPAITALILMGAGCNKKITTSPTESVKQTTTKLTIYEVKDMSYTCDKTEPRIIEVPETKAVAQAVLENLKMPVNNGKTMASYLNKPILIKNGVAYLDWKKSNEYANISTSCGSSAFNAEINDSLTQFTTIDKVIHSIEGDYQAFYDFIQVGVCPSEVKEYCSSTKQ